MFYHVLTLMWTWLKPLLWLCTYLWHNYYAISVYLNASDCHINVCLCNMTVDYNNCVQYKHCGLPWGKLYSSKAIWNCSSKDIFLRIICYTGILDSGWNLVNVNCFHVWPDYIIGSFRESTTCGYLNMNPLESMKLVIFWPLIELSRKISRCDWLHTYNFDWTIFK